MSRASRPRRRSDRHHALADPVGLLEVRIAGEDELVDAELVVLGDPVGDLLVAADQRGAGAAADEPDARPTGWARPRARRCGRRAARPSAAGPRTARRAGSPARAAICVGIEPVEQPLRPVAQASCGVSRAITCRRMPKRSSRPRRRRARATRVELLGDRLGRLAPGQVHVGVRGGDLERRGRGAAEVDLGQTGCGTICAPSHVEVLAGEVDRLARSTARGRRAGTRRRGRSGRPCRGDRRTAAARRRRRR